jgi:hypothetical protein
MILPSNVKTTMQSFAETIEATRSGIATETIFFSFVLVISKVFSEE